MEKPLFRTFRYIEAVDFASLLVSIYSWFLSVFINKMDIKDSEVIIEPCEQVVEPLNKPANVWVMRPGCDNIKVTPYDFKLNALFSKGFEYWMVYINGDKDYLVLFFDAENGSPYNKSAKWIAKLRNDLLPTGNFVLMRKKWIEQKEHTIEIEMSVKEVQSRFKNDVDGKM